MNNRTDKISSASDYLTCLRDKLSSNNNKPCLFLDIDGTLSDFQLDPNDCYIPSSTLDIINKIILEQIPVVAVTGRDIESARKLFETIDLPIAALHGLEIYLGKEKQLKTSKNFLEISYIYNILTKACSSYPDLLIENKSSSIALHYRKAPELENIAKKIILETQQVFPQLKLIQGKFVYELIPAQANKGLAIKEVLAHLKQQDAYAPIFIGDDVTDEDGFYVVNQIEQGISIKVGQGLTHARYQLEDTKQVHDFLELFLEHVQNHDNNINNIKGNNNLGGEKICLN
ncbi:trehalose-phosphatase [Acinetobacter courvalinii]|uniref:Trehalose 6-phosphate phosphatase n=1 Tax=Acinetobacter courvalinii TaxID=280147 RepID=N9R6E9_9GAMM|nr:trehalose-phosphatase [Acinetobacter courvalinii]ENX37896.1 trehalose-phosphatase [Acinetobacter courvalinii]KAB0658138.1 trehalose-phosphatase [Acinetobacter courvalinii]RSN84026.1 trehalose-phosphatase [Acinetobacter baumannii]GGH31599.1 trehalose 6-phosphate phosphatase [Acinetobacter courvalinii]